MKSTYSEELHVAIPTLDYIKSMTGIDVLLEEGEETRANGKITSLCAKARDFLMLDKSIEAQRITSYLIFKGTWLDAWLNYVVRYIEATFYYGDESTWETTPKPILNAIMGSVLAETRFTQNIVYEVRNSTEVF